MAQERKKEMAIIIKRGRQNASVIAQPTPIVRRFDFRQTE